MIAAAECPHARTAPARDLVGPYTLCLDCGSQIIFPPKPFKSSYPGEQYVADPEQWEAWLRTRELRFLRKVERKEGAA